MQPHSEAPKKYHPQLSAGETSEQVMTKDPSRTEKKKPQPKAEHCFITPMYKNAEQK